MDQRPQRSTGHLQEGPADGPVGRKDAPAEPVWLVRAVLYLFLVGFAAFVAVQARDVVRLF